ncbi:MTH1187 family thiamine-binding protein [Chloroflexota bacterium]
MRDSVIADVRILPFGTGTPSLSHYIAECVNILEQAPDIKYQVAPMATMVEGPLERVLELVLQMHEIPFTRGVERVVTCINIDDRRDKQITMESKVQAVAEKLQTSPEATLAGIVG